MVTKLKKIHSRGHVDYVVEQNGKIIYDIHLPEPERKLRLRDETFFIKRDNVLLYEMKMNIHHLNNSWSSEIFSNDGKKLGYSHRRDRKVNFFMGHTFYEFDFMGRRYELFAMSIKGIKLLIFDLETGEQVGLAESDGILRDNLNDWLLYAKNEQDGLMTLLSTLKMDYRRFMTRVRPQNNIQKIVIGAPKKLKERYQSSFKNGLV